MYKSLDEIQQRYMKAFKEREIAMDAWRELARKMNNALGSYIPGTGRYTGQQSAEYLELKHLEEDASRIMLKQYDVVRAIEKEMRQAIKSNTKEFIAMTNRVVAPSHIMKRRVRRGNAPFEISRR